MTANLSARQSASGAAPVLRSARSDLETLRRLVVVAGLGWAMAFIVVGLRYGLQMYADGSIFSYAVATEAAWAFHWHNISGRMFVYLASFVPAETYVRLTGHAAGGVFLYGLLHFSAPLVGLIATFRLDRSGDRLFFVYACLSTSCLLPLVFGFPTEMWMAHSVFWPVLTLCHGARRALVSTAAIFLGLLALALTHGGGVVLAAFIVATLLPRGFGDAIFKRAAMAFGLAILAWALVKLAFPPDPYFASIITAAALMFIDVGNLGSGLFVLTLGALALYGLVALLLFRVRPDTAHLNAVTVVAAALTLYWLWYDRALHGEERYALRTVLFVVAPLFGALAALGTLPARARRALPLVDRAMRRLSDGSAPRLAIGAVALVTLVHTVETTKFVSAWGRYRDAVRTLAAGPASDPALGDARFVSSARIGRDPNRLSWSSTTPYLSVLVAPNQAPARLVVDPAADYFWLSCATAKANEAAKRAVPAESRRLIRIYACLHRDESRPVPALPASASGSSH